jgi:hypothetical protein
VETWFWFFGLRVVPDEFGMVRDVAEITARITDYVSCAVGSTWSSSDDSLSHPGCWNKWGHELGFGTKETLNLWADLIFNVFF